ncbi:Phytochrome two-component sensor histidine kinase Cyanobacterial phytochrome B [Paramagnetospirillum magnetotacticum MS-1]|uniref:histidine kinase n=1 Tax=Paramagnetospirillum magnetotacticum MS-1 TaxID=272627 RepID=A0A0C2YF04_PARME|nr:PAS domain S-box protein [Paramagnetospirillum magnetotacticum]KIL98299.1 Phytochrome two-component sensor histidine kinase Cyanobacterial phytochrome B [Paramagnetospirillum magnetotacticum MS-1]
MDFKSLRIRILTLFLLSFLGAGAVVVLVLSGSLQRDVESLLARQQVTFVGGLAEEVDQKIKLQIEAMERVAALVLRDADATTLTAFLQDRTGIKGFFAGGLMILGRDGVVRAEGPALGRIGKDMAALAGVKSMVEAGHSVVGEPYFDPALNQPAVAIAVPIRQGEAVIGALVGTATLSQKNFLGRLVEQKVGETGGLYMVSPKSGLIVISTNKERIFTPVPARGQNRMLDRYMDGYEGSGVAFSSVGIEELTSARRIASTGWMLVARLPTAEAFEPVGGIKNRLMVALAVLGLLSLVLLWLVLRGTLAPLRRATERIQAMVEGRVPQQALEVSRGDEVGRLITAFNALQDKLAVADDALREREALYHALFSGCKAVEMLIDPADGGRIIDANRAAEIYYGWTHDQLVSMRISQINILDQSAIAEEMHKAKAEERDHFDFRHRLASGEIRDVEVWSGPVQVTGRKLLYSIVHDVTARRRAEHELGSLLAFRRAILDGAGSSIIATTIDGTIRLLNPTAEQWLGYGADEVVGRTTPALFHDPDEVAARAAQLSRELGREVEPGFECFVARTLLGGQPDSGEWTYVRKDGGRFRVLLTISALYDDDGQLSGFLGVAHDISARLSMERELQRSNAELENFAYVASHDLRQPLRMVSSYLTLLQRRLGESLDQDCREFIAYAVDGAQRMDHMITDLLGYSRIGRGGAPQEKVDLGDVMKLAQANLGALIEENGADITVSEGLPVVMGNEVELERLFQNLISNAVKFQVKGRSPQVDVTWSSSTDEWIISVRDNGIGIDEAGQARLFQIFQRLVGQDEYPGSGIGLASCRKIAEHHGGRIWVESVPGEGSVFHVALPKSVVR